MLVKTLRISPYTWETRDLHRVCGKQEIVSGGWKAELLEPSGLCRLQKSQFSDHPIIRLYHVMYHVTQIVMFLTPGLSDKIVKCKVKRNEYIDLLTHS